MSPEATPLRYIFRAAYKRRSRPANSTSRLREAPLVRHHRQVIRASPNRSHWHCTRKCQTNKLALGIEYIHCAIPLGYVEDISLNEAMTHPDLEDDTKNAVARAVNKSNLISHRRRSVMLTRVWIQKDLFARYHIAHQEFSSISAFTIIKPLDIFSVVEIISFGAPIQYLTSHT